MFKGFFFLSLILSAAIYAVPGQTEKTKDVVFINKGEETSAKEEVRPAPPEPVPAAGTDAPKGRQFPIRDERKNILPDGAAGGEPASENKDDAVPARPEIGYRFMRGEKEVNFEFGISPFRPSHFSGPEEYDTNDRKLGLLAFRWGRVIGTRKTITYQYLFEAIPFVYSYRNEVRNPNHVDPKTTPDEPPTKRKTSYGAAVTPVAFRFYFFSRNRLKPFAQFGAGILVTNKPMPLPDTSWFNFTGYYGGGALYHLTRRTAVTLSYRYYHISNFNTTDFNPGYNANTFSVGYSYFYK